MLDGLPLVLLPPSDGRCIHPLQGKQTESKTKNRQAFLPTITGKHHRVRTEKRGHGTSGAGSAFSTEHDMCLERGVDNEMN